MVEVQGRMPVLGTLRLVLAIVTIGGPSFSSVASAIVRQRYRALVLRDARRPESRDRWSTHSDRTGCYPCRHGRDVPFFRDNRPESQSALVVHPLPEWRDMA